MSFIPLMSLYRCDAHRKHLDDPHAHLQTQHKVEHLFKMLEEGALDAGTLWDEYGLRMDITVSVFSLSRILFQPK
jgi:hypothetical protein